MTYSKRLELNPLIDESGLSLIETMKQHPDAPKFNHFAGDRTTKEDLSRLKELRRELSEAPIQNEFSPLMLDRVLVWQKTVPLYRRWSASRWDLEKNWQRLPTTSREDLAREPEAFVPDDQDLSRLIVFKTSGTTGHPLIVPHHPLAVASYQVMMLEALRQHGIDPHFGPGKVGAFLIGYQERTVTYPTVLAGWGGAGFAKLNLNPSEWPTPQSPARFLNHFQPPLLTGDPISFSELLRLPLEYSPLALISTSLAMSSLLKMELESRLGTRVIDWYSLTETGPIGYAAPDGEGFHALPHDLFIEVLDEQGRQVPLGERGEVTVTGGRNPFIPLLRYRTGDWARLEVIKGELRIFDLEGRKPLYFKTRAGKRVNTVDISRTLRDFPIVQHEMVQASDLSCSLHIRPASVGIELERIRTALSRLFDGDVGFEIRVDNALGHRTGKVLPYRTELLLEE